VIFRNRKGQMTGELLPDGVYEQRLNRPAHAFHSRGELAIDTAHLDSLKALGAVRVRKVFGDTGETFEARWKPLHSMATRNSGALRMGHRHSSLRDIGDTRTQHRLRYFKEAKWNQKRD